ncbi:FAD-binding oxidoreductase [Protaetiibacter mangrovi]|uniref:FAD-binding oxidoreductase n=1 Tax=Protaetiibacter mangrovi TaxID=2970926 RepID=A0ABT1ZEB5_9MICO|nr:FAD-binding oxidoreductase [Protaetiibacter mangrovi]MCS0499059.1 FAD-binding oxidoreductase [Protaetiibacter mangrovi]
MSPRPTGWHAGTVVDIRQETRTAKRITLDVPGWPGNDAGSHLDLRLTAPDGYQASRSYSIASSGESTRVVLAVDEVPDGEVSPFLVHDVRPGDALEVHGPLGNYFIWDPAASASHVQLIAGGSGVVPLFAMADAHGRGGDPAGFRLLYSVRTPDDRFFAAELGELADRDRIDVTYRYTRSTPDGWPSPPGRVTRELLAETTWPADVAPAVYVCGPTPFVESVSDWLVELGHEPRAVRTERFGGG